MKGRRMVGMAVSTLFTANQSASGVKVLDMKQECPTYLKTIRKSKALATTLSDTELEDDLDDNDDEGILNAFTVTVDSTDGFRK